MKALAAVAILAVACTAVGCQKNMVHKRVLYVENPDHHCVKDFDAGPEIEWDYTTETHKISPGRIVYLCNDGFLVGFDKDKELPKLPAKTTTRGGKR